MEGCRTGARGRCRTDRHGLGVVRRRQSGRGPGRDHDRLQGRLQLRLRLRQRRRAGRVCPVRARQGQEQEQAVRGHDRHHGRGEADQDRRLRVRQRHGAAGCHRDEAPDGEAERGRDGRPALGRRGRVRRQLRKGPSEQDVHHRDGGLAGPDAANRAEERVPLPRGRRDVERRCWRDRLQEAQVAQGRDHHGRLQLRLDVRRGLHRRLLCHRRPDHEARVPAAQHDRLRAVRPAAAAAEPGRRLLLGRRRLGNGAVAEGVRAGVRQARPEEALREPVLRLPRCGQGRRAEGRRRLRGRFRHCPGPEDQGGERVPGDHEEVLPEAAA